MISTEPVAHPTVQGLLITRQALDADRARRLEANLMGERWQHWNRRLTEPRQVYGFRYQQAGTAVKPAPTIPNGLRELFPTVRKLGWTGPDPDQVLATLYERGHHLEPHTDSPLVGPMVAGISLGTAWPLIFTHVADGKRVVVELPAGSGYLLSGPARETWLHHVPGENRGRRISVTFRRLKAGVRYLENDDGPVSRPGG